MLPRLPRDAGADAVVAALDEVGACAIEGYLDDAAVAAMRAELEPVLASTPTGRNDFEGFLTRRVYNLFSKVRCFDGPACDPLLEAVLDRVLGPHQLSAPVAIDIGPGEPDQVLHRDDSVYPLPWPHDAVVLNTMWPLDEFTVENGATRFVPGSHRWPRDDPRFTDGSIEGLLERATMPAGSVLFYVGTLVHGGGANRTDRRRLGVILEFVAGWLRPQENHVVGVDRAVAATLPPRLQELLGWNVYPPFLGYVDGRHPRRVAGFAS